MNNYKKYYLKYNLKPLKYNIIGKVLIITTNNGKYVLKKNYNNKKIYDYLNSRNFENYPKIINEEDDIIIYKYIPESDIPREQKFQDMIDLVGLLHYKTSHIKEVNTDVFKSLYEDIKNNVNYLRGYYTDIISVIETRVFMSPAEYLLARNISKVFMAIDFCDRELEEWYKLVKDKTKERITVLHNNLSLNHFIRNKNSYLINWDKAKIDLSIFDLYKLYRNHALEFDFEDALKRYEKHYPLEEDERKLFFILIAMPGIVLLDNNEYETCKNLTKEINLIYKTEKFISPYYSDKT